MYVAFSNMSRLASEIYDFAFEVTEIDESLLVELLGEASIIECTMLDNLDCHDQDCEDCGLDHNDMVAEFDGHECSEETSWSGACMMIADDDPLGDCVGEIHTCDEFYCGEPMGPCGYL